MSNADAVAASLINAIYSKLGPRQNVIQGFDLRNDQHRAHVTAFIQHNGGSRDVLLGDSPLFYSSMDNVFTRPGLVSLQLLLDVSSQIIPSPPEGVVKVILDFPQRHELKFTDPWADTLEFADSPEYKMQPRIKTPVHFDPRTTEQVGMSKLRMDGYPETSASHPSSHPSSHSSSSSSSSPSLSGLTQTQTNYIAGMDTYADVSVFDKMTHEIEQGQGSGFIVGAAGMGVSSQASGGTGAGAGAESVRERGSGAMNIESRIFKRIPHIRTMIDSGKQISEKDLMPEGFSSSPKDMEDQIKQARYERAQLSKKFRTAGKS